MDRSSQLIALLLCAVTLTYGVLVFAIGHAGTTSETAPSAIAAPAPVGAASEAEPIDTVPTEAEAPVEVSMLRPDTPDRPRIRTKRRPILCLAP